MAKPKGAPKTGGRKKGTPNKVTADLKDAILGALEAEGGQAYLERVAKSDPRTFCSLLGRVLPMQVQGDPEFPLMPVLNIALSRNKS
jgi:hypothetical protein